MKLPRPLTALFAEPGRWPRLLVLAACGLVLVLYCANRDMGGDPVSPRGDGKYRPVLARGDGHMLYLMARSTALDFDWDFTNDLRRFGDPWNEPITKTGRKSIVHPIGPALVWTPLIWTAEAGAAFVNLFGADIPLHGYTLWHQRFVFLSSVVFACGAVLLGRRAARASVGGAWAPSYAATAVLLGTSLTYYCTNMASYGHAMDAFACAAFLAAWIATLGRTDLRRWCVLGALLGLATLIRVQEVAMGEVIVLEAIWTTVHAIRARDGSWQTTARRYLVGGLVSLGVTAILFIPQLIEWHVVFGSATGLPQGARFTRLNAPMVMEVLFSARNGWFTTTPLAYAGCIGLFLLPRRSRLVATGLILVVATQVFLNSTVLDWWSGASFGQRRLCSVTLPLVVGLAAVVWRCGRALARARRLPAVARHAACVLVLGAFVAWNLQRVTHLAHGSPAPSELTPTCCDGVPRPLRGVASWFYDRIGNPFELPASAYFAVRYGVPLSRWDQTVGAYPLIAGLADLHDDRFWQVRGRWSIGAPGLEPFLLDGWSRSQQLDHRACRVTTARRASVLVPNLMPENQRFTLWLAGGGHVRIEWNGDQVAEATVGPTWTPVTFQLADVAVHTNVLTVVGDPGVAVSDLELQLVAP